MLVEGEGQAACLHGEGGKQDVSGERGEMGC